MQRVKLLMKSDSWKGVVYSSQKDAETVKIMGNLFFGGSGAGNRLRVNVKDLKTGRITSITVPRPHEVSNRGRVRKIQRTWVVSFHKSQSFLLSHTVHCGAVVGTHTEHRRKKSDAKVQEKRHCWRQETSCGHIWRSYEQRNVRANDKDCQLVLREGGKKRRAIERLGTLCQDPYGKNLRYQILKPASTWKPRLHTYNNASLSLSLPLLPPLTSLFPGGKYYRAQAVNWRRMWRQTRADASRPRQSATGGEH